MQSSEMQVKYGFGSGKINHFYDQEYNENLL